MSETFSLFHVSNLSIPNLKIYPNFRIFLPMYPGYTMHALRVTTYGGEKHGAFCAAKCNGAPVGVA